MRKLVRFALLLGLMAVHGAATALGLGEITVRSGIGQPLLAEIEIISSDPAELEQLQARLASPDTFRRVGLEPPAGLVSDLRFMVALDNDGNPVIRVTSSQPVDQALLTFLVEVDWGQGRLVREYSALLDAPRTVSAPVQPAIDAPSVSQPNLIERPLSQVEPPPAEPLAEVPLEGPPSPAPEGAEAVPADADAVAPTAAPAPSPAARPARPMATIEGDQYRVQGGDTLSEVAVRLADRRGLSMNQTMVALLRANPEAFIDGNVHRMKAGAVLRVPGAEEALTLDAAEANAIVREQTRQWRQGRTAVPQPAVADAPEPVAPDDTQGAAGAGGAVADARLEIVPPGASDTAQAGNQSGASAGGEGDMLRQEMQTREELAARDAEIGEMKARLAELEDLQEKQAALIELKDSELAAAQQQLAATTAAQPDASVMPWILGGVAMLVLGLVAGLMLRRRPAKAAFRAPAEAPAGRGSLADAFPGAAAVPATAVASDADEEALDGGYPPADEVPEDGAPLPEAAVSGAATDAGDTRSGASDGSGDIEVPPASRGLPLAWQSGGVGAGVEDGDAPAWHTGEAAVDVDAPAAGAATGGGSERLELARAYIALGDHDSARQLLGEVRVHGDLEARQQAMKLLRELG